MPLQITKDSIDIGLVTGRIDAMREFYCNTLGLEVEAIIEMPGGAQMTRLICGTTIIKLVVQKHIPDTGNPPGGLAGGTGIRYFTISVDNLEDAVEECRAAGYTVAVPIVEARPGIRIAMIEDPDGNWVELLKHV